LSQNLTNSRKQLDEFEFLEDEPSLNQLIVVNNQNLVQPNVEKALFQEQEKISFKISQLNYIR
jgi:hypothetical protein